MSGGLYHLLRNNIKMKIWKTQINSKNNNQNIIINNTNNNNNNSDPRFNNPKNKWISILLLLCTGCGHKFYEGKIIMGIIYILTLGFLGIGIFIDFLILLGKPNPYYVI